MVAHAVPRSKWLISLKLFIPLCPPSNDVWLCSQHYVFMEVPPVVSPIVHTFIMLMPGHLGGSWLVG